MSLKAELTVTKEQLARESFPVFSNDSETEQQPEGSILTRLYKTTLSGAQW